MENLCNCNEDVSNLGEPDYCCDQMIRQPDYVSVQDGRYYEDGIFKGNIIDFIKNKDGSRIHIKYKLICANRYMNGTIKNVTFTPKDKR